MCTTKKMKKDKNSSDKIPPQKKSKKSKNSSKTVETVKKAVSIEKPEKPNEPVTAPEVTPPPPIVKIEPPQKLLVEMKTQPESTVILKKAAKTKSRSTNDRNSIQMASTGKTSEDTQLSDTTIRTEMLENAQCNPFAIDVKKMLTMLNGCAKENTKFTDNSDYDTDSTLCGIYSDFEAFSLPKLARKGCPPEVPLKRPPATPRKKKTTKRQQRTKPTKSSPNEQSVDTQRSE